MEVMLMDFLKLRILNNSRSVLRTSLKFCTMKETKRYFMILMAFLKMEFIWGKCGIFLPKTALS